jgi:hypothetical protein
MLVWHTSQMYEPNFELSERPTNPSTTRSAVTTFPSVLGAHCRCARASSLIDPWAGIRILLDIHNGFIQSNGASKVRAFLEPGILDVI